MALRMYWKGYLKLSLVSCAVALVPATTTTERTRFHTLNRATGNRLRQRMVDEVTEEVVEREDRVKGYEIGRGTYVQVEDDELDKIALESNHTIEIESFVPRTEIDKRYLDAPYYLIPNDNVSQEAFAVIREAMRDEKRVALARVVLHRRERIVMIEAFEKGMLATTLRYAYEVRDAKPYFEEIPEVTVPAEMKKLATHILDQKAAHFDPTKFDDRYEEAVQALLKAKQAGLPTREPETPSPSNVINIMDALRQSVAAAKRAHPRAARDAGRRKPVAKKSPARATARGRARRAG
ncbi:MAG TPA: Ku protein [Pseudorhodoplanes sp.]|nr:Ku protein [Pseudorhodoplanes sp.]